MDRVPALRRRPTPWRRVDVAGRVLFPAVSSGCLQLVLAASFGLPGQAALRPAAALACIFFWSLYRPRSMTPLAAFLLGLLSDLLGDGPIGITLVGLLVAQGIALRWRHVLLRNDPALAFLAFCGVALLYAGVAYSLSSLLAFTLLPLGPVLFQAALAAGCYPLLCLPLALAHRGLADPERA